MLRYHQHMHGNFSLGLFLTDHTWILLEVVMETGFDWVWVGFGSGLGRFQVGFGSGLGKIWVEFGLGSGIFLGVGSVGL